MLPGRAPSPDTRPRSPRPFVRLPRPTAATETTIAVFSDLHFSLTGRGTSKQLHRTSGHLSTALEDVAGRDLDAVVCLGDLVQGGRRDNYDLLEAAFSDLAVPVHVVPGNHDAASDSPDGTASPTAFESRFAPLSYPFAVEVGGVTVIGLDTESERSPLGDGGLDDAVADPDAAICCLHRPLGPAVEALERWVAELGTGLTVLDPYAEADAVEAFVAERGLPLVLSGHLHVPLVAQVPPEPSRPGEGGWTEISAPPLCTYPQGYLLLTVTGVGTEVAFVPVASRETLRETRAARASASEHDAELTRVARTVLEASSEERAVNCEARSEHE